MKLVLRFVYGFVPVPIVYTDALPEGVGGEARGPLVRIRPKYRERGDEGIHQHELVHVRQFWALWAQAGAYGGAIAAGIAGLLVGFAAMWPTALWAAGMAAVAHPLAYRFIRSYRRWSEAKAYAAQTAYPNGLGGSLSLDDAASRLAAPRYKLGLTAEQAKTCILWA